MINSTFKKPISFKTHKKNNKNHDDELTLCYRVMINQHYVTKWKIYIKDESEKEAKQLGGKVSKSFINLKKGY